MKSFLNELKNGEEVKNNKKSWKKFKKIKIEIALHAFIL